MATTTGLGTVNTSGTSSFITGTATGLNSAALIQLALNAKLLPKNRLDAQISTNVNKIAAFQALQTQAAAFKTVSDKLKSDTILGNTFAQKQLTYSTSDGTAASSILTASTSTGAQAGTYKIVVSQLAKAQTVASAVQTSATTALGYTGSFTIGEAGKTAATINVTAGMTLQNLRNAINATSSTSGVKADILQTGTNQYKLTLSAIDTNKSITVGGITGNNVLNSLDVIDGSNAFKHQVQPAQAAAFTLNDEPVTSDSNNISNLLTGLNINLVNSAPGVTVTITSGNNTSGAAEVINDFVAKYNTLQSTIKAFQLVNSDGTVDAGAYLYGESLNSSLGQQVSKLITATYGNAGSSFNGLRSLGIKLDPSNQLTVDSATLNNALQSNYDDVAAVFATNGTTSTGLADQVSTLVDSYSNIVSGSIYKQINSLTARDVTLQAKSDSIQASVDAYKIQLINKYAQLESIYKQADTTKRQLAALIKTNSDN